MSNVQAVSGAFAHPRNLLRPRGGGAWRDAIRPACAVLVCFALAAAAVTQMRIEQGRAAAQMARIGRVQASQGASQLGAALDRLALVGTAFASARGSAETSAALARSAGPALQDVAVLGPNGELLSQMTAMPSVLLPVPPSILGQASRSRTVLRHKSRIALLFPYAHAIVVLLIRADRLLIWKGMPNAFLAQSSVKPTGGLVVHRVPGWPLVLGIRLPVQESAADYNFLLYFLALLGGAILVPLTLIGPRGKRRDADPRERLRDTKPQETRLTVRLARAERRAAEAESAKSRFVSHISHELRTPLNAIIGFAEAIESGVFGSPGHPKYAEYAHDIGLAGRELHAKIGMVLEYSALSAAAETVRSAEAPPVCDAAATARAQLAIFGTPARERGIRLEALLPDSAPARVERDVLERILAHLLDNGIAYTPPGGTVRVQVQPGVRDITIVLHDSGDGLTRSERDLAGEPFQRFGRTGNRPGMGLGLAIAKGLTRRIGGTLTIASVPGEGTCAELRLPACL